MSPLSHYERLGGAQALRALVNRFYDLMDTLPEARKIRRLHPAELDGSREKLFEFLSGWLGGPPLYVSRHGHPRLRARHLPFAIGNEERDAWMLCMDRAMAELGVEKSLRGELHASFFRTADFMRNQPEVRSAGATPNPDEAAQS